MILIISRVQLYGMNGHVMRKSISNILSQLFGSSGYGYNVTFSSALTFSIGS